MSLNSFAFSPDGRRVAATFMAPDHDDPKASGSGVRVWDLAGGKEILQVERPSSTMHEWSGVAFAPDGARLAMALGYRGSVAAEEREKTVLVLDAASGREVVTLKAPVNGSYLGWSGGSSLAFSPDGARLTAASGGWD